MKFYIILNKFRCYFVFSFCYVFQQYENINKFRQYKKLAKNFKEISFFFQVEMSNKKKIKLNI